MVPVEIAMKKNALEKRALDVTAMKKEEQEKARRVICEPFQII